MFFCFVGVYGRLELFTLLLFGVQWFCSPFPVERCSEMEFVQTCRSISHLNVSFVYVGVHAVYAVLNGWCKIIHAACRSCFIGCIISVCRPLLPVSAFR
jgi:hypothetical protein